MTTRDRFTDTGNEPLDFYTLKTLPKNEAEAELRRLERQRERLQREDLPE